MKTTLVIPDALYRKVKQRAAEQRRSVSDLVAELLRAGLRPPAATSANVPPLPSYDMGPAWIDLADRDALENAMRPST